MSELLEKYQDQIIIVVMAVVLLFGGVLFFFSPKGPELKVEFDGGRNYSGMVATIEEEGKKTQFFQLFYDGELKKNFSKEELQNLVKDLYEDGYAEVEVETKKVKLSSKTKNLIFDVTYSYRDGKIDTREPEIRLDRALAFLKKNPKGNLAKEIVVGFLGAEKNPGEEGKTIKDLYTFVLEDYKAGEILKISTTYKDDIKYRKHSGQFMLNDLSLTLDKRATMLGECIEEDQKQYICTNPDILVEKIKEISKKYLNEKYAYGTYLLEYLANNKGNGFDLKGDFLIFSDGEFQLQTKTQKNTLASLNAIYRLKDGIHFGATEFTNRKWFTNYWDRAIPSLRYLTKFCQQNENMISFIGMEEAESPAYVEYAQDFFQKLFDGCEIEVL